MAPVAFMALAAAAAACASTHGCPLASVESPREVWLSYYNNRTAMAPMAFMVLAAAAAACASTHGCPLASVDGFLTAEDTPTRSSSREFRRDETNPTSPARHSTTKFLSLPIGVEVTPTFDYNFWRYDQRSITFRDSYSTPKPTASLWNSTIFVIFGQPFLDYVDDNLSGFEAWAWASCPDTGTY